MDGYENTNGLDSSFVLSTVIWSMNDFMFGPRAMIKVDLYKWLKDKDIGEKLARSKFIREHIWFGWYWMDYDGEMHYIMKWYRMRDPDGKYRYTVKSAIGVTI